MFDDLEAVNVLYKTSFILYKSITKLECGWRDSNSQGVRHTPLKRACLPIPPHPQESTLQLYTFCALSSKHLRWETRFVGSVARYYKWRSLEAIISFTRR